MAMSKVQIHLQLTINFIFTFSLFLLLSLLVLSMSDKFDKGLKESVIWLSSHSPAQPNLVRVESGALLDNLVSQQVAPLLSPFYHISSQHSLSVYSVKELTAPQEVIDAYLLFFFIFLLL